VQVLIKPVIASRLGNTNLEDILVGKNTVSPPYHTIQPIEIRRRWKQFLCGRRKIKTVKMSASTLLTVCIYCYDRISTITMNGFA